MDPLLTLALAMHNVRGGYALLLGSGISRAAGIPTGWEVVETLIRRVAALEGDAARTAAEADAAGWYTTRFDGPPSYSRLLEQTAATPAERRELLRPFFEPTADERDQGLKLPTKAHRAVARLMRDGIVKVAITPNFDQLLETALRDEGVTPAVVSSPDMVQGMMPLHLTAATVIKPHGDYLDTRIKNTPEELAVYEPAMNALLDRVIDEYGLVVCGWSGSWDDALRSALLRAPSRRFSTFWATKGDLTAEAQQIIDQRRAFVIQIDSADAFLDAVAEKVATLESFDRPHPITKAVAVEMLKRYLPVPEQRIRLHDLLVDEAARTASRVASSIDPAAPLSTLSVVRDTMSRVETSCETLMAILATGCFWGEPALRSEWVSVLERLGSRAAFGNVATGSTNTVWENLWRYPAQLLFYAGGLGALARGVDAEETVGDLLLAPRLRFSLTGNVEWPVIGLNSSEAVEPRVAAQLPGWEGHYTPISDHLFTILQPVISPLMGDPDGYADLFDHWEYVVALAYADYRLRDREGWPLWAPVGRLAWRREQIFGRPTARDVVNDEITRQGANWLLLRRGLFRGSVPEIQSAVSEIDKLLSRRGPA